MAAPTPHLLASSPAQVAYEQVELWQSALQPPATALLDPVDVTWVEDESYLVTDAGLHRVLRINLDGQVEAVYGGPGGDPGELYRPSGAASAGGAGPDGDVFVADTGNGRIAVFAPDGTAVRQWETGGEPLAVARVPEMQGRAPTGSVAVVRREPPVQGGDPSLLYVDSYTPDGKMVSECLMDVDAEGAVRFVASRGGPLDPQDPLPASVYLVAGGELFRWPYHGCVGAVAQTGGELMDAAVEAADGGNWWYATTGGRVRRKHAADPGTHDMYSAAPEALRAIDLAPDDTAVIAVRRLGERFAGVYRVAKYPDREVTWVFGEPQTQLGWLGHTQRLVAASDGSVYAGDDIERVQRLDAAGTAVGQTELRTHVAFDAAADGDVFSVRVLDGSSDEDPTDPERPPAGFRRTVLTRRSYNGPMTTDRLELAAGQVMWRRVLAEVPMAATAPRVVAAAYAELENRVYALDAGGGRVYAASEDGSAVEEWPLPDLAGRPGYVDMAAAPAGGVAVLHTGASSLVWLVAGVVVDTWTVPTGAYRVAIGADGVVVLATSDGQLHALAADGTPLADWPSYSSSGPEPPADIAVGPTGRVYEADFARAAIAVFERHGQLPPTAPPAASPTPSATATPTDEPAASATPGAPFAVFLPATHA